VIYQVTGKSLMGYSVDMIFNADWCEEEKRGTWYYRGGWRVIFVPNGLQCEPA